MGDCGCYRTDAHKAIKQQLRKARSEGMDSLTSSWTASGGKSGLHMHSAHAPQRRSLAHVLRREDKDCT